MSAKQKINRIEYVLEFWCSREKLSEWRSDSPLPRYERGDLFDLGDEGQVSGPVGIFRVVDVVNSFSSLPDFSRESLQRVYLESTGETHPPGY